MCLRLAWTNIGMWITLNDLAECSMCVHVGRGIRILHPLFGAACHSPLLFTIVLVQQHHVALATRLLITCSNFSDLNIYPTLPDQMTVVRYSENVLLGSPKLRHLFRSLLNCGKVSRTCLKFTT